MKCHPDAILPKKAHSDDACFDLYSAEEFHLDPGAIRVVSTGYNIALPQGYAGLVCSRSGLAAKLGIFVLNSPGIIDAGYRGELKVILHNSVMWHKTFKVGDRIAQLLIQKVLPFTAVEVDQFEDETTRGAGGFGSTGV
jgi:dUTP pyrophosphatase